MKFNTTVFAGFLCWLCLCIGVWASAENLTKFKKPNHLWQGIMKKSPAKQEALQARKKPEHVEIDGVTLIRGPSTNAKHLDKGEPSKTPVEAAEKFLKKNRAILFDTDAFSELRIAKQGEVSKGQVLLDFEQVYRGYPVYGGGVRVEVSVDKNEVTLIVNDTKPVKEPKQIVSKMADRQAAINAALLELGKLTEDERLFKLRQALVDGRPPEGDLAKAISFPGIENPRADLRVVLVEGEPLLVWWVSVSIRNKLASYYVVLEAEHLTLLDVLKLAIVR
jgi:Zn-dependent metalloprotease